MESAVLEYSKSIATEEASARSGRLAGMRIRAIESLVSFVPFVI